MREQHEPVVPARTHLQPIRPESKWGRHGFDGIDCGLGVMPGGGHP